MYPYPYQPELSLSGSGSPSISISLENKINIEFSDDRLRIYADVDPTGVKRLRRVLSLSLIK